MLNEARVNTSISAYEIAKQMYETRNENLDDDIVLYAKHEYLYISPENLILARCCPDYWFVQVAVGQGSLLLFLELMPKDKYRPMVAWARGMRSENIKFYQTEILRKKLCSKLDSQTLSKKIADATLEAQRCLNLQAHQFLHQMQAERLQG